MTDDNMIKSPSGEYVPKGIIYSAWCGNKTNLKYLMYSTKQKKLKCRL